MSVIKFTRLIPGNVCVQAEGISDSNWTRTQNHLVREPTFNHLAKLAKWLSCVLSTCLYGAFDCMFLSCHVRILEWIHTLYLAECQGFLVRSRREIWRISDCNWTRTLNHLVHKRTLNHLAELAKWSRCVLSTYLYGAFDCMTSIDIEVIRTVYY